MGWEFIQAHSSQAKEINDLVNSAYRGDSAKRGWTSEADLIGGQRIDTPGIKELIDRDDSVVLIAENENNGVIEGCVHLQKQDEKCYLGMLTVKPTLQGKGLGGQILEEAEAFAQFWDCSVIFMTVISKRTELIEWYEKRGYKNTGVTKPFPYGEEQFGLPKVDGLVFVILEKRIME